MRTLLVGLDNSRKEPPHRALWPIPDSSVGARLMRLIDANVDEDYRPGSFVLDFARTNLYPMRRAPNGQGKLTQDMDAMTHIISSAMVMGVSDVVLIGKRVVEAYNRLLREGKVEWTDPVGWMESSVLDIPGSVLRFWAVPYPSKRQLPYLEHREAMGKLLTRLRNRTSIPHRTNVVQSIEKVMR